MDYNQIKEALDPFPELESPSFVQGMLIGLLCGNDNLAEAEWIKKLIEEAKITSLKESMLKTLDTIYQATHKGLNSSALDLELCLPTDNAPLTIRAAMLGQLCEGVLYGLGQTGALKESENKQPPQVREMIEDFAEISRIDLSGLEEATPPEEEAQESDFIELVEFVRMGVLALNEDLNPIKAAPVMPESDQSQTPTIH